VGHAISGVVKPHPLVFQKAKYCFKKNRQLFLVMFIGGEFAESHPLLLIFQIGQISCDSCDLSSCTIARIVLILGLAILRRCWLPGDIHVALHRLCQLRIHFVRDRHNIRQQQAEVQRTQILLQRPKKRYLEYS
jgi:hypothetical protein